MTPRSALLNTACAGLAVVGIAGCVDDQALRAETTSLRVELVAPASIGSFDMRLPEPIKSVTVQVTALDIHGQVDTGFSRQVQAYAQFMGTMTPPLGSTNPLARIDLVDGVSPPVTIALPTAYGATNVWIEDAAGDGPTYATGASPTIWHHEPFIASVSTPAPGALAPLRESPLEGKQVTISGSRYGDVGRMVVTSTYSQGYTVSDAKCADATGKPPCVAGDYDHLLVYTFSAPGFRGRAIQVGDVVAKLGGGVQEFNGLTELSFPATVLKDEPNDPARVPAPLEIDDTWFEDPLTFEKIETGLVSIPGGTICATDNDYTRYGQWKVALDGNCSNRAQIINLVTLGVVPFDPTKAMGKKLGRTVGALRPVNFSSGSSIWIIYPRTAADLTLPTN